MKSRVGERERGEKGSMFSTGLELRLVQAGQGGTRQGKGLVVCPAPQSNNLKQDCYCLRVDVGLTREKSSLCTDHYRHHGSSWQE